ncbi:MAG: hypothetical protein QOC84_1271, partial [Bradyrhizobium sp.]|nr:hypothetical protein [Bradyrhizobium sp.]
GRASRILGKRTLGKVTQLALPGT